MFKGSAFAKIRLIYSYSRVTCWFQSKSRTLVLGKRQGSGYIVDNNTVVWHFFAGMQHRVTMHQWKGYCVKTRLQVIYLTIHLIWNALS